MNEEQDIKKPSKWRVFRWILGILSIIVFLVVGIAAGVSLYVINALQPVEASDGDVRLTIDRGTSSAAIAQTLEDQGLIRNHIVFKYYLRFQDQGGRFQAGTYDFQKGLTHDEIIAKLNNGETVQAEMIRFTIPEGFTVRQIIKKLSEEGLVEEEVFLQLVQDEIFSFGFIDEIPEDENLLFRLEGYLFPETYEMTKGSSEKDIIHRMLRELDRKLATLPKDWKMVMKEKELSFHQLLTIASIIEREVVVVEEQPVVAGIIYNRLDRGMNLQVDATIQYLFDEQKHIVTYDDLEIDSPYNTYEYPGLPPGPVSNPSQSAIHAALYPEQTEYFFYVTKKDGTREHYFSKNYNEHLANIEKSNLNKQNQ